MASIYRKSPTSDVIWIRYRDAAGKWKGKPTSYRWANIGEVRQAKLLARRQSEVEAQERGCESQRFGEWVLPWIIEKYGALETTTPDRYKRMWRTLMRFLDAHSIATASQLTREDAGKYLAWRKESAGRNAAIAELKMLAMVIDEAVVRKHRLDNPLRKLGLKKAPTKPKEIWSDEDMAKAAKHFEKHKCRWMRCAFYFGVYQACRLRQCQLPVSGIRFDLGVIQYPDRLVKGHQGYTQPIDPRFLPILKKLVQEAQAEGERMICTIPWDASLRLRKALDRAGLEGLCHHGLRATWITRAAENGIPESQAMAFCHHESREVHRIYKRLSAVGIAHVPSLMSLPTF
jgi:integrase